MSKDASSSTRPSSSQNKETLKLAWDDILKNVYSEFTQSTPTMVFSVIGDTDSFVPTTWPVSVFETALIEAARNGGETWILHHGNDKGLSSIIRNAYQKYEIKEFGTKTVGISDPHKHIKLINVAKDERQETKTKPIPQVSDAKGIQSDQLTSIYQIPNQFFETDTFCMEFENFISEQEIFFFGSDIDFKIPIPITLIVCGGDSGTITHISKALQNNIPVIIMKGSGKAADLVLSYLESPDEIIQKAGDQIGIKNEDEELKNHLTKIKAYRSHVGVFDLDHDDPLMMLSIVGNMVVNCKSIQQALERYKNDVQRKESGKQRTTSQIQETLKFPMGAHKPRISSSIYWIYKKKFYWKQGYKKLDVEGKCSRPYVLNSKYFNPTSLPLCFYFGYHIVDVCGPALLFEALKHNRCDYVDALLDRGVKFNMNKLFQLYEETITEDDVNFPTADAILKVLKTMKKEDELSRILKTKLKEEDQNNVDRDLDRDLSRSIENAVKRLCRETLGIFEIKRIQKNEDDFISNVLLWAIFANRIELAEMFWLKGTNHLYTGIICSGLLKKLAVSNLDNEPVLSLEQKKHSIIFEHRCLSIMDGMYKENQEHSINSMSRHSKIWGIDSSPLTMALESSNYDIVAHISSKKNMDRIWENNFESNIFQKKTKFSLLAKSLYGCCSPKNRFILSSILDLVFLIMCSVFVLTSVDTKYNDQGFAQLLEYPVYLWSIGNVVESSYMQVLLMVDKFNNQHSFSFWKLKRNIWVWLDSASYSLLIAAFFVRHYYNDNTFSVARQLYALSLLFMYFRCLKYLRIHKKMGMLVIMMLKMMTHLLSFLALAVILGLGVGVYYHANLWPDHQTMWNGDVVDWRIWKILLFPHWQLYGELDIQSIDGSDQEDCTNDTSIWEVDPSIKRCPQKDWTVPLITAIYLMVSNLLLVNIVIAKFSFIYEEVQEKSEKLWHYDRYQVICEYKIRLPSPFNIPIRFIQTWYYWICYLIKGTCNNTVRPDQPNHDTDKDLEEFQKMMAFEITQKKTEEKQ